jgi:hypothetical protein
MAERIVSPGVFTEEKDLSFLPQGIAGIGAAFIGPTIKGPAFIPTPVGSYGDFVQTFGDTNPNLYLPYAAKEYLQNSGQLTVVRVLHDDGYQAKTPLYIIASGSYGRRNIGMLHPSQTVADSGLTFNRSTPEDLFEKSTIVGSAGNAVIKISGSYLADASFTPPVVAGTTGMTYSASLSSTNANYISKVFGRVPTTTTAPAYLQTFFGIAASASLAADAGTVLELASGSYQSESTYSEATTPWIISQTVNSTNYNLFKFHTIADGVNSNYEIKVAISNIKAAGSVAGSNYGSFTVTIRAVDQTYLNTVGSPYTYTDSDLRPNILESFDNVNLDPNSPRYIARVIGDRYKTFTSGKVVVYGDYSNKSKYVYVEVDTNVANGVNSPILVPFGFAALNSPIPSGITQPTPAVLVVSQSINGIYNKRKYFGFDFDFSTTDNINYLCPLPSLTSTTGQTTFLLSNCYQDSGAGTGYSGSVDLTTSTVLSSRQFIVPFQGGFDGAQPNKRILVGSDIASTNTQGYNIATSTAADYSVYKNAIDTVSNPDEIDINMLYIPGVIQSLHPAVIDYAAQMCLDRADTFFVYDCVRLTDNIDTAVSTVQTQDNNYAATYYPWVKIVDSNINKPVWVPPGVVIPSVLAFNDRVAAEWYAPAGLNRGGLTMVTDAYTRLTHAERDTLYEGRINPIATFPGVGVCVWGQKTLQAKPSALDRVNVRRLLIAVKKYIASATRYLVFEQNTAATRNRFLNIVNPYLESVQQRQGLYAFRVVMDETNNTPDLIDRNTMYGQIFLQPTKTAEFIVLDFNILPTGAAFPGA